MLDKKAPRDKGGLLKTDYYGVEVENEFLFGFGLDYHGYMRNVPEIHAVDAKHMI
jgi:hypoxanthine phosphoribosyltransferase